MWFGGVAQFPHRRVQLGQGLGATRGGLFDGAFDVQNLPAVQISGEHLARPIHKVVGFIDEKSVCATVFGKVPPQINLRIEDVIVIADDGVHPQGHIQGKFKRTHLMFLADFFKHDAGDFFPLQGFADRGFDAVIITQRERTCQQIARLAITHTDFFLRGDRHGAQFQSGPA